MGKTNCLKLKIFPCMLQVKRYELGYNKSGYIIESLKGKDKNAKL